MHQFNSPELADQSTHHPYHRLELESFSAIIGNEANVAGEGGGELAIQPKRRLKPNNELKTNSISP
jgi:hypothetical protein